MNTDATPRCNAKGVESGADNQPDCFKERCTQEEKANTERTTPGVHPEIYSDHMEILKCLVSFLFSLAFLLSFTLGTRLGI